MKKVIFFCILAFSTVTWAGDSTTLNFIGFSHNGKYLAFQQHGVTDGEGVAFAKTYFINVKNNQYAIRPIETIEEYDEEPSGDGAAPTIKRLNILQAKPKLAQLGIIEKNNGQHVIRHPTSDIGTDPHKVRFVIDPTLPMPLQTTYTLELTETAAAADCFGMGGSHKMELSLLNESTKKEIILQKDRKIPTSRGCPLSYRVQDVYVYDKYIAVFLNMYTLGFEGKNMRYLVVTGLLE